MKKLNIIQVNNTKSEIVNACKDMFKYLKKKQTNRSQKKFWELMLSYLYFKKKFRYKKTQIKTKVANSYIKKYSAFINN